MSVIQYVKDDWTIVLPYRLRHNRYRGASRPSYALLCLLYYSIKSFLILYFYGAFRIYKFILWDLWEWLLNRGESADQLHSDDSSQPCDEQIKEEEVDIDYKDEAVCEQFADDEVIDIDEMDGATFEHFCADLLRVNGWTDVRVTPASGDHGIDITAEKDDIKWGFQCKRWGDTKVDAIAIGQTYKGKALYECDMVAVITTSTLTAQAEGEAKQLGIKVWGRGKIRQLMSNLDNADDYYLSA